MTNTVLIKRSATANAVPTTGQLANGEIAINYADGNLFFKDSGGSVQTLASKKFVSVSGNVTGGNVNTGIVSATGNVIAGNVNTGIVSATGNVIAGNLNAAGLSLSSNVIGALVSAANITTTANIAGGYFIGNGSQLTGLPESYSNANVSTLLANFGSNTVSTSGNVTTGNLIVNGNITYVNSNVVTINDKFINVANNAATSGAANGGGLGVGPVDAEYATLTFNNGTTAWNTNIPLSVNGNVAGSYFVGNGSALTSITGANVAGTVANATYAVSAGSAGSAVTAEQITYAIQSNITGVGTLGNLSVSGNTTVGNLSTGGFVSATGNITGSYFIGNGSLLTGIAASSYGNANVVANLAALGSNPISTTGNVTAGYVVANGSLLTNITGANVTGTVANATFATSAGTATSATTAATVTDATQANITSVGILTSLSATGNITGANINGNGSGLSSITGANVTGTVANATYATSAGTATSATTAGAVTSNAQANITSVGILTSLSASGNINGGNLNAAGLSLSSNVVSALNVTGDIAGANITTPGLISATGNITGGNILGGANVNATTHTGTTVSVSGNITGSNTVVTTAVVVPTVRNTAALTISTGAGDLNLQPAGNVVVNSKYINGVSDPVQNQDVATKAYVDNFATTGISYHSPVAAATTTTLATTTGGTITYTQPNGAGNGVGALLTTTGSFNLIDTANVQTLGTRILIKNEANAVYNGVYTWANATNIVRSTDTDEYGADSVTQLSINDYFFTTGGNVNAGAAFIVSAPAGTITFGTSNITFSTFSTSQVYSANTSAGISLAGTVINAKVDGVTTSFDGSGNISVKASANLTTPNIGAATGTSLSVTGNITGGNILGGANVNATTHTGTTVSVTGNITGGNVLGGANVNATTHTGTTVSVTGNITGGNVLGGANVNATTHTGTTVSVTGNITGGNVLGGANVNATTHTGTTVSVTGNITGGNIITAANAYFTGAAARIFGDFTNATVANRTMFQTNTVDGATNIYAIPNGAGTNSTWTAVNNSTAANAGIIQVGATASDTRITSGITGTGTYLPLSVYTSGTEKLNIAADTTGTFTFKGTAPRILGDFSNATIASRTMFQTTAANSATNIYIIPSGTSPNSSFTAVNNSDPTNAGILQVVVTSTEARLSADRTGSGTYLPMTFFANNAEAMRIATTGVVSVVGNITSGNVLTSGLISATGNVTGAGHVGTIYTNSIINTGANLTGNIGSSTLYFNTVFAKATSAQYADLAEYYSADAEYEPGTVVSFGGVQEITMCTAINDPRVAGVISTNPAHVMNSGLDSEHVATVALTGRVPTLVIGPVLPGDMMVSAGGGRAKACATPAMGTVIGKALQTHPGGQGMIEVVIGRI
jgi:hypothetical protein